MVPRDDHDYDSSSSSSSSRAPGRLPSLNLPPRNSIENLFTVGPSSAGVSPGPMSLVSRFFSENDPDSDCRSFSQLLAGAMSSSPAAAVRPSFRQSTTKEEGGGGNMELRLHQSRPTGLVVTQPSMFTIPPGLSPATLLDSPGLFSYTQQQVMAQLTAQSAQAQEQIHVPAERTSLSGAPAPRSSRLEFMRMHPAKKRPAPVPVPDPGSTTKESPDVSSPGHRSQPCITGDKPADDGYNWRKYGQKQVKGSEFPRSYYKCTNQNCPVKKKVERSLDGQVTEIIYKGQHNHQPPPSSKRAKEGGNTDVNQNQPWSMGLGSTGMAENMNTMDEFGHADPENASRSSDSDDLGGAENGADRGDDNEPELKRRNIEVPDPAMLHRTVTEPRIIVQTTSEVDLLDDGYRWRKYGQKVVKGNPYPRSYYKCTFSGCNVRKHVERAANDPKAVITTYESKHSHDVPAAKNSGPSSTAGAPKPPNSAAENAVAGQRIEEFKIMEQQPLAFLRFKEEQMT